MLISSIGVANTNNNDLNTQNVRSMPIVDYVTVQALNL